MAKVLRCRDVGVDCNFEARGASEEEVLQKAREHAKSVHGMDEIPSGLEQKVRAAIREE